MPRIAGVNIPGEKKIKIALTYIYGIGHTSAGMILKSADVDPEKRAKELTEAEIGRISSVISSNYIVEGDLRREIQLNMRRLFQINCYRAMRHRRNLPVRGQRTRSNARTRRGKRKTVGSVRPGSKRKQT